MILSPGGHAACETTLQQHRHHQRSLGRMVSRQSTGSMRFTWLMQIENVKTWDNSGHQHDEEPSLQHALCDDAPRRPDPRCTTNLVLHQKFTLDLIPADFGRDAQLSALIISSNRQGLARSSPTKSRTQRSHESQTPTLFVSKHPGLRCACPRVWTANNDSPGEA